MRKSLEVPFTMATSEQNVIIKFCSLLLDDQTNNFILTCPRVAGGRCIIDNWIKTVTKNKNKRHTEKKIKIEKHNSLKLFK